MVRTEGVDHHEDDVAGVRMEFPLGIAPDEKEERQSHGCSRLGDRDPRVERSPGAADGIWPGVKGHEAEGYTLGLAARRSGTRMLGFGPLLRLGSSRGIDARSRRCRVEFG